MKSKKTKKSRPFRPLKVWAIVTALVLVAAIVVNDLALTTFDGLFDTLFGGQRPIYDEETTSMYVATEASSKEEALKNSQALNVEIAR